MSLLEDIIKFELFRRIFLGQMGKRIIFWLLGAFVIFVIIVSILVALILSLFKKY